MFRNIFLKRKNQLFRFHHYIEFLILSKKISQISTNSLFFIVFSITITRNLQKMFVNNETLQKLITVLDYLLSRIRVKFYVLNPFLNNLQFTLLSIFCFIFCGRHWIIFKKPISKMENLWAFLRLNLGACWTNMQS